jgi:lipid-binding SYLF domain-containing protein
MQAIPLRLISQARGLAFLTVLKGGFVFAPSIGESWLLFIIC